MTIMTRGRNFSLFVVVVLVCGLCCLREVAAAVQAGGGEPQRAQETQPMTVNYFGRLSFHSDFSNHPMSNDPLWLLQGGEVVLSNAAHTFRVPTKADGSFVVYDVPYGTYHLHAEFAHYIYPTIRVDVTQKTSQGIVAPIIRTYANDAEMTPVRGTGLDDSSPAIIPFSGVHAYYVPRVQYTIWHLLTNPMILLMIMTMGMLGLMRLVPEEERRMSMQELKRLREEMSGATADTRRVPAKAGGEARKVK